MISSSAVEVSCESPSSEVPPSNSSSQPVLVEIGKRILAKDSEAESELYSYILRGVSFWLRFSNSPDLKIEVAHDVFIVCLQSIRQGRIHDMDRLPGFVLTVVKRLISKRRQQLIQSSYRFKEYCGEMLPDIGVSHTRSFEDEERREQIIEVLNGLMPFDRELLLRFYFLGETPPEVCAAMGISNTQFRVGKHRAKQRLMERFKATQSLQDLKKLAMARKV